MPKQLKFDEEARSALLKGVTIMAAAVKARVPVRSPRAAVVHGPMAKLTMAKLKIVLAKSYRAQERPSTELPERVSRPSPCHHETGFSDWAETVTPRSPTVTFSARAPR